VQRIGVDRDLAVAAAGRRVDREADRRGIARRIGIGSGGPFGRRLDEPPE